MRIIISPAKKMREDTDSFAVRDLPRFLPQAQRLLERLRSMDYDSLKKLWKCNDQIAALNFRRVQEMELERSLTPALLSYVGIQYQYMAPGVFTWEELEYVQTHLRILSGFYGLLRPFDAVTPYRLEMQARLAVDGARDLYAFWGGRLAAALAEESVLLIDLASKEYSQAVLPHLPPAVRVISCTFGEQKEGRVVEKGTACKMARGEMVRYLAQNNITDPEDIKYFDRLGYTYHPEYSGEGRYVFLK